MTRALALVCAAALLALPARAQDYKRNLGDPALEGLWQSPELGAWIRIWPDAFGFQCRTPAGTGPVYSDGLVIGWIVLWDQHWSSQAASIVDDKLVLYDGRQKVELVRAVRMASSCADFLPRPETAPH